MINRFTSLVARHPWRVILVWLVIGAGAAMYARAHQSEVTTSDTSTFLPNKYESVRATQIGQRLFGEAKGASTVTALVKRADGAPLTAGDRRTIAQLSGAMTHKPRVVSAQVSAPQDHGRFELLGLQFKGNDSDPVVQRAFRHVRDVTQGEFRSHGLNAGFTSGVASAADYGKYNAKTANLEQLLLFAAIILLNPLFFRGILAAVVPLVAVMLVAATAGGFVVMAAKALGFEFDVTTPQLITTVLIGIGTDYYLFLAFRFREQLRSGDGRTQAAAVAGGQIAVVIASAALAVAAAFATLGLAQFGQFRALGPAVAISVLVMLVAGVTLFPALLAAAGPKLYWPSRSWRRAREHGPASRIGKLVARRPAVVATTTVALLAALALGATGVTMNYDLETNAPHAESTRVADEINRSLPRGVTDPQHVYVTSTARLNPAELEPLRASLAEVDGVGQVAAPVLSADRHAADVALALDYNSTTKRAMDIAGGPLREAAHANAPRGSQAFVGGTASVYSDVSGSINHDLRVIFPLAAALILAILVVLLRSVVAPIYLLVAVTLEFAATLGAATLLFQNGLGQPGVAFTMPLVLFLFVVALGTDYNILMSSRLREEELKGTPVREAVAVAFRHAAPAIGAAGLILASSFGTLAIYHDQGTKQMGFAMSVGILIAAFVVSSFLVPAMAALVGPKAWWPGLRDGKPRRPARSATPAEAAPVAQG